MSPYLLIVPLSLGVLNLLVELAIARYKKLNVFRGSYFYKSLGAMPGRSVEDVIADVKHLYLGAKVHHLYINAEYICFEDPGFFGRRNVYYIKLSELDKLYYRGVNRVYKANKRNLETISFFLQVRET
ncbi:MAG: hypothetical protein U1B83_07840 [Candidatus Cloacimonadaceae bacterium]|nr:hypothetical protein [Candidatus Cloacimonadaceae bacterium]